MIGAVSSSRRAAALSGGEQLEQLVAGFFSPFAGTFRHEFNSCVTVRTVTVFGQ
jgi:hypothetical protein